MINYIDSVHFQNLPIYGVRIHPTTGFPSNPSNGQIVYDTSSNRYFFYKGNASGWYLLGSGSFLQEWNAISGGNSRQSNQTFIMGSGGAIRYSGGGIVDANRFNGRQTLALSDGGTNSTSAFANAIVFTNVSADTYLTDAYLRAQYAPTQYSISIGDTAGGPFRGAVTIGNEGLAPALYIAPKSLVSPTGANYFEWNGNNFFITDQYCIARARVLTDQDLLSSMTGILPLNLGGTNQNQPYQSGSIIITDGNQYLGIRPSGAGQAGLLQVGENLSNGSGYKWLVGNYGYPAEVAFWDGSEWTSVDSTQYFVYNSPQGSNYNYIIPTSGNHALYVQLGSAQEDYEGFIVKSPTGANRFSINGSGQAVFYEGAFRLFGTSGTMVDFRNPTSGQVLGFNGTKWVPANVSGGGGVGSGVSYLSGLLDVTITSASSGQFLIYNGDKWVNASASSNSSFATGIMDAGASGYHFTLPFNGPVPVYVYERANGIIGQQAFPRIEHTSVTGVTIRFNDITTTGYVAIFGLAASPTGGQSGVGDGGITSINGLTSLTQTFATGVAGIDFNISSTASTHTFNIPTASSTARGILSSGDWVIFNNKQSTSLTSGQVWIGTNQNLASGIFIGGDATIIGTGVLTLANTNVTPGSYTITSLTVDSKGRITSASNGTLTSGNLPTNIMYTGIANINDLADVDTWSFSEGNFLVYQNNAWRNITIPTGQNILHNTLGNLNLDGHNQYLHRYPTISNRNIVHGTGNEPVVTLWGNPVNSGPIFVAANTGIISGYVHVSNSGSLIIGSPTGTARLVLGPPTGYLQQIQFTPTDNSLINISGQAGLMSVRRVGGSYYGLYYKANPTGNFSEVILGDITQFIYGQKIFDDLWLRNINADNSIRFNTDFAIDESWNYYLPNTSGVLLLTPYQPNNNKAVAFDAGNSVSGRVEFRVITTGDLPSNIMYTGIASLGQLSDVSIGAQTSGQTLSYNGAKWVAATQTSNGVSIHNALNGLNNDDHPQYLLVNPTGTNRNVISGSTDAIIPLTILGLSTQSAPMFRAYNSSSPSSRYTEINTSGNVNIGAVSGGFARLTIGSGNITIPSLIIENSPGGGPAAGPYGGISSYNGFLYYKTPNSLSHPNDIALAGDLTVEQFYYNAARVFDRIGIRSSADSIHYITFYGESNLESFVPPEVSGVILIGSPESHVWSNRNKVAFSSGNNIQGAVEFRNITSGDLPNNVMYTGIASLNNLVDVNITSPSINQVIKYSGGKWVNASDDAGSGGNYLRLSPENGTVNTVDTTNADDYALAVSYNETYTSSILGYGAAAFISGIKIGSSVTSLSTTSGMLDVSSVDGYHTSIFRGNTSSTGDLVQFRNATGCTVSISASGDFSIVSTGARFKIAEGLMAGTGKVAVVAGTSVANIRNPLITNNSHITITPRRIQAASITNVGVLFVYRQVAGSGFMVRSSNAADTSSFNWLVIELT